VLRNVCKLSGLDRERNPGAVERVGSTNRVGAGNVSRPKSPCGTRKGSMGIALGGACSHTELFFIVVECMDLDIYMHIICNYLKKYQYVSMYIYGTYIDEPYVYTYHVCEDLGKVAWTMETHVVSDISSSEKNTMLLIG